ncbi:hypothetical protein T492DRAFT_1054512, partial [Pavlovales sp. CCMP2436]
MVQQVLFSHWLGRRQAEVERSTQTITHAPALTPKGVSVWAPAPTPRLGRRSPAVAAAGSSIVFVAL